MTLDSKFGGKSALEVEQWWRWRRSRGGSRDGGELVLEVEFATAMVMVSAAARARGGGDLIAEVCSAAQSPTCIRARLAALTNDSVNDLRTSAHASGRQPTAWLTPG